MKPRKLIAAAMFAAMALAIAGPAGAGPRTFARPASHAARRAGIGSRAGLRRWNRRFFPSYQYFPYYPYSYYPYCNYGYYNYPNYPCYGNVVVENPDQAGWDEQWSSLYEDNDGPYARSTRENPPGEEQMWEFPAQ